MFYTRQLPPTVIDVAYEVGDLWLDQPSGRVWRYAGPGQWEPWSTSAGKPVGAEQLFPGPDGSDIGLADAPTSDGLYALGVDGGDIEWAEIEGLPPVGDDGDVLTVVDGAWASAPAGLPGPDPTGATAGHVWTADGDDGADWAAPSGGGGSLWSETVRGGGTPTATGTPGSALARAGSPSTFTVAIPHDQLVVGAIFRVLCSAFGAFGDELKLNAAGSGQLITGTGNGDFVSQVLISIRAAGENGAIVVGSSTSEWDLSDVAPLDVFISGEGFMSNDMTGTLLHVERVA